MEVLQAIFSNTIIAFILLIGIVVFVHELGHFIAGKIFGIQVEEFSIGFGPKAFSIKKGTTDYRINWFPLGGYVRFYGADIEENIPIEHREKSILHAKVYKRAIVSFAGPLANFVLSFVLLTGMSISGIPQELPIISVLPNSVAERSGFVTGDKILSIDDKEISSWVQLSTIITKNAEKNLNIIIERDGKQRNIEIIPRKEEVETIFGNKQTVGRIGIVNSFNSSNIVVLKGSFFESLGLKTGDKILFINEKKTEYLFEVINEIQRVSNTLSEYELARNVQNNYYENLNTNIHIEIERIIDNSKLTAKNVKLNINLNDKNIKSWSSLFLQTHKSVNLTWNKDLLSTDQTISQFSTIAKGNKLISTQDAWKNCGIKAGDTLYSVENYGRILSLSQFYIWLDTTAKSFVSNVNKTNISDLKLSVIRANGSMALLNCKIPLRDGFDHLNREQLFLDFPLNFMTQNKALKPVLLKAQTVTDAFNRGFHSMLNQMTLTFTGIKMLLTGSIPLSNLGGPIAIAGVAGDAAKGGFMTFIFTMAFISINVGMMNLLPFPALDGGSLLLHAVEAAYGKPLPKSVQLGVQRAGVLILLGLFVVVFYNDILRLIRF
ncbi:RIP metalloprotease RseP [Fluviispira multicolorata]|uniref:RIP metalloprotease RseP n=1 Tax=Fluviispira multicolorata TaxID=2654512 RepID=A0A833JGU4_9BACT|nr:RIP metalloprotease RseP [Fluviispira multicolorata]KAB8033178.1 RIP metalloprotease RseP [Fluviispira multicolorata]